MDLNTVEQIVCPCRRAEIPPMKSGDAILAGGTWLFSEPQTDLRRLVDVTALRWPPLERTQAGLRIGATCTLAELEHYQPPESWRAAGVIGQCCRALLGSFKIRKMATVGGNLCLALPAAPMAALVVALDGACEIWTEDGSERSVAAGRLITGPGRTVLRPGEIMRAVLLPELALRRRATLRQISLTPLGRSAVLLIGTRDGDAMALTITAAVARPVRVAFASVPTREALADAIEAAVPDWYNDIHGRPEWRRRMTHLMAAEIRDELGAS